MSHIVLFIHTYMGAAGKPGGVGLLKVEIFTAYDYEPVIGVEKYISYLFRCKNIIFVKVLSSSSISCVCVLKVEFSPFEFR